MVTALQKLAANHAGKNDFSVVEDAYSMAFPTVPEQVLSPREALFGHTKTIPFKQAAGRVCAEIITFYPPGIPLLCRERGSPRRPSLTANGCRRRGCTFPGLRTIR
jgi:lysine decarboxylase